MSDLKFFRIDNHVARELVGGPIALEKSLQTLIEHNMETLLGVRFLASEFVTGPKHGGRIDSLGLDENNCPVIVEYKRSVHENVINQGLFYLDWLMDHRGDFTVLVQKQLQSPTSPIDFDNARLVCVASDFTRYDAHAIAQMGRSIDLYRYCDFGGEFLALDLVASASAPTATPSAAKPHGKGAGGVKTVSDYLDQAPEALQDLYDQLEVGLVAMGDDVTKKVTQQYIAFRRSKNFACVEVHPQANKLLVFVKVDPGSVALEKGFTRDVRSIGHFGTGDLEITVRNSDDLLKAQPLVSVSYQAN